MPIALESEINLKWNILYIRTLKNIDRAASYNYCGLVEIVSPLLDPFLDHGASGPWGQLKRQSIELGTLERKLLGVREAYSS